VKITNKHNLPESLVRAVTHDDYTRGDADYSVTDIISPPQIVQLCRRYWDKIEEDAIDRIWLLLGTACHAVLERSASKNVLSEERLYIDTPYGKLSGKPDLYYNIQEGCLEDYKVTSAWTIVFGGRDEWKQQLNCYAQLYRNAGFQVNHLRTIAILRDWNRRATERNDGYPKQQVAVINYEPDAGVLITEFINQRMALQRENETRSDYEFTPCTVEDRWQRPTTWALMKKGRKSALKICHSELEALAELDEKDKNHYIDERPGKAIRCEDYCSVQPFCCQYAAQREVEE